MNGRGFAYGLPTHLQGGVLRVHIELYCLQFDRLWWLVGRSLD